MTFRKETLAEGVELYLGDARELEPPNGVDCIVTSPPYNQLDELAKRPPSGIWGDSHGGASFVSAWKENGYADDLDETQYQEQQNALFARLAAFCSPTASLFYNHQVRWRNGVALHPIRWFQPEPWRLREEIIWDRAGGMMLNARMFVRFDERIIWFVRGDQWKWNQSSVGLGTIWRVAREQNKEHPLAFPLELPTRCIDATTDPCDLVLDPYCGSGTSGVAAIRLGRRFVGFEREQKWFDLSCRNLEAALRQPTMFVETPAPLKQTSMFSDKVA